MFNIFKSKTEVPLTNDTISVPVAKVWMVSWDARHGEFSGETRRVSKAFLCKEDAQHFADALRAAYKLLQHTSGTWVEIKEQQ